jgi:hypothetical protein
MRVNQDLLLAQALNYAASATKNDILLTMPVAG